MYVFDTAVYNLCQQLGAICRSKQQKLVTAESCTGGLLAAAITDVAGSSAWFERGFVTYTNAAKTELLAVDNHILVRHGAVSGATVIAMATGALDHSHADIAISVSGIAGPSGGSAEKPVGLVYLGFAVKDQQARSVRCAFVGSRYEIRQQAVEQALLESLQILQN